MAQKREATLPTGKRIYFRSDSAAYQAEVINYYCQRGRTFTTTDDLRAAVKRKIENLPETASQPYRTAEGVATDREVAETVHTMNRTQLAFRHIVLRWLNPQPNRFEAERYGYHAVAMNQGGRGASHRETQRAGEQRGLAQGTEDRGRDGAAVLRAARSQPP